MISVKNTNFLAKSHSLGVGTEQPKHPLNLLFSGWVAFCCNAVLSLVCVLHLAYLGMLFEGSSDSQQTGFSMAHTLAKWSSLSYASHWLSFGMFVVISVL